MTRARKKAPEEAKPTPTKNDWTTQRYETRALSTLRLHPENAHKGDEEAIGESIDENGAFGVLGIQASTGHILHGNHTFKRLLAKGYSEFACLVYDVDDDLALRILIAHNETQRGGKTDEKKMADALAKVSTTRGLGIRPPDVSRLLEMARPKLSFLEKMRAAENVAPAPVALLDDESDASDEQDDDADDPGGEDYEDEEAAGAPERDADDDTGDEAGAGGDVRVGDGTPEVAAADRPRIPLAIVLSTNEARRWNEYKASVEERGDKAAFLMLLAAAQNRDP